MKEKKLTGYPSIDKPWLKYYSEEAINTPLPECTIYEYLWERNRDYLSATALRYFGRRFSFRELFENIDKAANAFAALGLKKGDIIIIATATMPETVYALYGLNKIGVIPNMVDPRTSAEGIRDYILEVDAKVVMTLDIAYDRITDAVRGTNVDTIIVASPGDSLPPVKRVMYKALNRLKGIVPKLDKKSYSWTQFIADGQQDIAQSVPYEKDTCCVIVHTGGTTGFPKGVMLSNDNVNALAVQSILTGIDMTRDHNWMDMMPPFVAYGIGMGLHLPLVIGMETILVPSFDADKFDELLLEHKPIHMVGVPYHWSVVIHSKKLQNKDLSRIIAPTVGGDTMDTELERNANAFLAQHGCNYRITKGYGMSEVCAGVAGAVDANNEIGSVGIPFVHSLISIFDPDTEEELPYGEIGEVCISGPNVMLGYYNNPGETAHILRTHTDGRVWVHSGDLGYMNEKGSLFIIDRMKKVIIKHDGFKVFPSAIEKVIISHPGIDKCCVVGAPDRNHAYGKEPVVFAVISPGYAEDTQALKQELILLCRKELPEYVQPVEYRFVDAFPMTAIGKVDFRALEKEAQSL